MKFKRQFIKVFLLCAVVLCLVSACFFHADDYYESEPSIDPDNIFTIESDPPYYFEDPDEECENTECDQKKTEKYVLNIRSKKIHKTTSGTGDLILPENRVVYEGNIEDLYKTGYTKCGNCFK